MVATYQPTKLAAMEGLSKTTRGAPEAIGGYYSGGKLHDALKIPDGLSLLAKLNPNATIKGLDAFPADDRPPLVTVVHLSFDAMVAIGFGLLALGAWLAWSWWRSHDHPSSKWFLRAVAVSGIAATAAMEFGWITTEVGRQPWIVYGVMRVANAVNPEPGIQYGFYAVVGIYAVLTVVLIAVLRHMTRSRPDSRCPARVRCPGVPSHVSNVRGAPAIRSDFPMTLPELLAAVLWVGVTLYALFGGADFGAGFWDLIAGGAERGAHKRKLIEHSIGPVWEANHVWLIFILVVMWTGFPPLFGAVSSTLWIPLTLAAFGVIARGSSFAFRKVATDVRQQRIFGGGFAAVLGRHSVLSGCRRRRCRRGPGATRRRTGQRLDAVGGTPCRS